MIIAVWGSSGAGKSTLAAKLAAAFSKDRKKVILIDTNFIVPQAGIWFPRLRIEPQESLTAILQSEINPEILAGKIHLINDYLGVLGYAKGELAMNSILQRYDTAAVLLNTASSIVDYVILDCQTNITQDYLTFVALEMAAAKLIICTPDLRGVSFWMSNTPMLGDAKYRLNDAIRILNQVREISPVSAIAQQIGSVQYALPYDTGILEESLVGALGSSGKTKAASRFQKVFLSLKSEITKSQIE